MKQLLVDSIPLQLGASIALRAEQLHYLMNVRRVAEGSEILCRDASGRAATARVGIQSSDRLELRVVALHDEPASADLGTGPGVAVAVSLLKGRKIDGVVRQLTELGVARVVPVLAERSVSRPAGAEARKKRQRWDAIAREATQQSGRDTIPLFEEPCSVAQLAPLGPGLVMSEVAGASLRPSFSQIADGAGSEILVLVGPEGGLSPSELNALEAAGWLAVTLPLPVLRAETAAVVVAALVLLEVSDYTAPSQA